MKLLPNGRYVFLFDGLKKNPGGITRVMMNRVNSFIKNGAQCKILLDGRNINQLDNVQLFKQRGYSYVEEENFVYWADFLGDELENENVNHQLDCINFNEMQKKSIEYRIDNTIYYYMQGKLVAKENITNEMTRFIDFVDEYGVVYQRQTIRKERLISITEYIRFPNGKEKKVITRFVSKNNFVFASIVKENNLEKITLFDEKNNDIISIDSKHEMRKYFWHKYIKHCKEKNIFVFCDIVHYQDPFFDSIRYIESKNVFTIAIIHDVGYRNGKIAPVVRKLLEGNDCDAFITLTEQAKNDYQKDLGEKDFMYVINNPIILPKNVRNFNSRNRRLIFVGRIAPIKQIEHIVKAFCKASEVVQDLELYIVGFSSIENSKNEYENKIIELVNSLQSGNIFIKGFSDDVTDEYQNSVIGLFCSKSEAFLLSLAECMANGCVPISYDCKYGPRDIIRNGENGLIIENNIDSMALAIQRLMENEVLLKRMSENAVSDSQRFSEDAVFERWLEVIWNLVSKRSDHNRDVESNKNKNECSVGGYSFYVDIPLSYSERRCA